MLLARCAGLVELACPWHTVGSAPSESPKDGVALPDGEYERSHLLGGVPPQHLLPLNAARREAFGQLFSVFDADFTGDANVLALLLVLSWQRGAEARRSPLSSAAADLAQCSLRLLPSTEHPGATVAPELVNFGGQPVVTPAQASILPVPGCRTADVVRVFDESLSGLPATAALLPLLAAISLLWIGRLSLL